MPFKNLKKRKEYNKNYRSEHLEDIKRANKEWYLNNKNRVKKYQEDNKERITEWQKKYDQKRAGSKKDRARITRLTSGGIGYHNVIKKPYPKTQKCQLCKKVKEHLEYHHWDKIESGIEIKGIWICHLCHKFITLMELNPNYPNLYKKYIKIKKKINETARNDV